MLTIGKTVGRGMRQGEVRNTWEHYFLLSFSVKDKSALNKKSVIKKEEKKRKKWEVESREE